MVETDGDGILSDTKVVDLSEGLPLTVADSELGSENLEINLGKASAYSEVISFSKAGAYGSPFTKRAKKHLIFVAGNNKNKSPPYVVGRNKAPPKFNERCVRNGRQGYDSS